MAEKKKKHGRPSAYTKELAASICERMAAGESLRSICAAEGMPSDTAVRGWAIRDEGGFSSQYAQAREIRMDRWAEEIVDIADDSEGDVNRDRLRVDTRKWVMSKLAPKQYGDKGIELSIPGTITVNIVPLGAKAKGGD